MIRRRFLLWGLAAVGAASPTAVWADGKGKKAAEPEPQFVRVVRDPQGTVQSLDVAVVRYGYGAKDPKAESGVAVDLIGAVHIGDKGYYKALNEAFDTYDVVLYEFVAPPGKNVPQKGGGGSSP